MTRPDTNEPSATAPNEPSATATEESKPPEPIRERVAALTLFLCSSCGAAGEDPQEVIEHQKEINHEGVETLEVFIGDTTRDMLQFPQVVMRVEYNDQGTVVVLARKLPQTTRIIRCSPQTWADTVCRNKGILRKEGPFFVAKPEKPRKSDGSGKS